MMPLTRKPTMKKVEKKDKRRKLFSISKGGQNAGSVISSQSSMHNHPLFHRRQTNFDGKNRKWFAWMRIPPVINRLFRTTKGTIDPDTPVLGTREVEECKKLCFTTNDRKKLLAMFKEMAGPKRNTVPYKAFTKYFKFSSDIWVRRLFELINSQLTGAFTFYEFLVFIVRYLAIDQQATEEFCFRILSRRGMTFLADFSILDLDDILCFVSFRYIEFDTLPMQKKIALDLTAFLDKDNDGGICLSEFHDFCKTNGVFMRHTHPLQNHLRKAILGMDVWVEKTRRARSLAQGLTVIDNVAANARVNAESEMYTIMHIKDGNGVVDHAGHAFTNEHFLREFHSTHHKHREAMHKHQLTMAGDHSVVSVLSPQASSIGQLSAQNSSVNSFGNLQSAGGLSSIDSYDDPPSITSHNSHVASSAAGGNRGVQLLLQTGTSGVDLLNKSRDYRKESSWPLPFSMQSTLHALTNHEQKPSFAVDFPEVVKAKQIKKQERRAIETRRRMAILSLSDNTYQRLVKSISDLVFQRRKQRMAFEKWAKIAGLETVATVTVSPERTTLNRLTSNMSFKEDDGLSSRMSMRVQQKQQEGLTKALGVSIQQLQLLKPGNHFRLPKKEDSNNSNTNNDIDELDVSPTSSPISRVRSSMMFTRSLDSLEEDEEHRLVQEEGGDALLDEDLSSIEASMSVKIVIERSAVHESIMRTSQLQWEQQQNKAFDNYCNETITARLIRRCVKGAGAGDYDDINGEDNVRYLRRMVDEAHLLLERDFPVPPSSGYASHHTNSNQHEEETKQYQQQQQRILQPKQSFAQASKSKDKAAVHKVDDVEDLWGGAGDDDDDYEDDD